MFVFVKLNLISLVVVGRTNSYSEEFDDKKYDRSKVSKESSSIIRIIFHVLCFVFVCVCVKSHLIPFSIGREEQIIILKY